MLRKSSSWLVLLVLVTSMLLSCAPAAAPTQAPPEPTTAVEPTAAPPEPTPIPPTEEVQAAEPNALILATTTSTQDSGLLDVLLPDFKSQYNTDVQVVAVGTGQAIQLGVDCNADVLLVHARAREDEFMAAGNGSRREDVMYNDFIIVGPESDPAGIKGMTSAAEALAKIAEAQAPFISRGDDSGTHTKELAVWKAAGIEPAGDWYISAGQGMGEVLTMSDEQQAYTLSDRATYLARTKEGLGLNILVEGDKVLFNPYGVIVVNPEKCPTVKADLANTFTDWIVSLPAQEKIGRFGVEDFGQSLFVPDSAAWREANPPAAEPSGAAPAVAALKISGDIAAEMAWTEDELKAMETLDVDYTNKDGETTTYTGVAINALLEMAGVPPDTTLVLVASDGYTAEATAAELQGCADCIVGFDPEGGLRSVLPPLSGKLQVKGLNEIQVKAGGGEQPSAGIPENAALKITGNVAQEVGWTEEEVRAMETIDAQSTNKQGQTETYTGVPINTLLQMAGPNADAITVVYVADDGFTGEVPLADVQGCADCIVSFREKGGFSIVMPGFPGNVQVKGVIEIQVK